MLVHIGSNYLQVILNLCSKLLLVLSGQDLCANELRYSLHLQVHLPGRCFEHLVIRLAIHKESAEESDDEMIASMISGQLSELVLGR